MSTSVRIRSSDIEPLRLFVRRRDNSNALTGSSNIMIRILRTSDNFALDWADMTFKASAHTTLDMAMSEVNAALAPGLYELAPDFSAGGVTNPSEDDNYIIYPIENGSTDAALPDPGELKIDQWIENLGIVVASGV